MECACVPEMLDISCRLVPHQVCLVPEKREEVTTEGGLDVIANRSRIEDAIKQLHDAGIIVSLFIDPSEDQIRLASEIGADAVELHTGTYAESDLGATRAAQVQLLTDGCQLGGELGLQIHAGHGLTYSNVVPIAQIPGMEELNIGHSIVSRALFVGFEQAVREMKRLCDTANR
jgi:pyridoxine 5-phosphate synthase